MDCYSKTMTSPISSMVRLNESCLPSIVSPQNPDIEVRNNHPIQGHASLHCNMTTSSLKAPSFNNMHDFVQSRVRKAGQEPLALDDNLNFLCPPHYENNGTLRLQQKALCQELSVAVSAYGSWRDRCLEFDLKIGKACLSGLLPRKPSEWHLLKSILNKALISRESYLPTPMFYLSSEFVRD